MTTLFTTFATRGVSGDPRRDGRGRSTPLALIITALLSCAATAVAFLLLANLTLGNKKIDFRVQEVVAVSDPQFVRSMGLLLNAPVLQGNSVQALPNGDAFFPSMLAAIRAARETITFETYIYWSGTIGAEFAEAFIERARAGVRVHVLIDWWGGEDIQDRYRESMEAAGVEIGVYNPLRLTGLARMNNRTHRKLLVVDGTIGFTGGAGIADAWRGDAQDAQHWRDSHFRVQGPVVAQLQSAFMDNWMSVSGRVLHGQGYFPAIKPAGSHSAQVFTSAPGGGAESAQLLYLMSIAAARGSIRLSMAYFVPDDVAIATLIAARRRGVRVQIILPGPHMDRPVVQRASRFEWGSLLEAGVEIYEYQPTMYHCKVLIVDTLWTSVGSTNFDSRSFSVNDEANLNIYSAEFARDQEQLFDADLKRSRGVSLDEWRGRRWRDKLLDALAGAFSSQL